MKSLENAGRTTATPSHTPRVSVLMTAYNSEKYIAEAIESILSQTFTDFEFFIINDGSTDNTANIIAQYAKQDKRIKFINNPTNNGRIVVLNQGLSLCSGEYIALMDSDDVSLPKRFATQVAYMNTHPECGVLGTSYHQFGCSDTDVHMKQNISYIDMLNMCNIANPSAMIRREIFIKHDLRYRAEYTNAEDYDLWARMIQITQIHNLPDILLKYRWHGENVSIRQKQIQQESTAKIKLYMLNFLSDNPVLRKKLLQVVRKSRFFNPMFLSKHMLFHHPIKYFKLKRAVNYE